MTPQDQALKLLGEALVALANTSPTDASATVTVTHTVTTATGWSRARLWEVPDATRLDAEDLAAILNVDRGALYKKVRRESIPHRKRRDKSLCFVAGDIRRWLENGEHVVTPVTDYGPRPRRIK